MRFKPPKWPDLFLSWFCDPDQLEEIRGDIYELFYYRVTQDGPRIAQLSFLWDVIRYLRPSNSRFHLPISLKTQMSMFKSYFKIASRSLRKHWGTSLINISGLSLSVGCAITTFMFADFFFNLNTFHEKRDRIYQVISVIEENDDQVLYGPSATVMKERLVTDHPSVEFATSLFYLPGKAKFGQNVFHENVLFTDSDFLKIFSFNLGKGLPQDFEFGTVMLSSELATKYFGDVDPIGREMSIKFADDISESFLVAGVFEKFPINNSFRPGIMVHKDHLKRVAGIQENWIDNNRATFISLKSDKNDPNDLNKLLESYRVTQNEANPKGPVLKYELKVLEDLSLIAGSIRERAIYGNDASGTVGIAVVGFLLLLFACLNYVNIALASATRRLKEVGIRKVMGSSRGNIVTQFLVENFLLCALAMIIGVVSAYFLLLPGFNSISPVEIPFLFSSPVTAITYFVTLFVALGILSGIYPAIYISKMHALDTFRGDAKLSGKNRLSKALLTFQFFLVFFTVLTCFIFTDNAQYVKKLSWGYDPSNMIAISASGSELETLAEEMTRQSNVISVSTAKGHIGVKNELVDFKYLDQQFKTLTYDVTASYFSTLGIEIENGKNFKENTDKNSVIINERFAEKMGWENPIGESFEWQNENKTVIGVIENVHHAFFDQDILRPIVFTSDNTKHDHLIVKTQENQRDHADLVLQEKWYELMPEDPYERHIQADVFDRHYRNVDANTLFMLSTSFMTILLSCLGLYGLLAFSLQKRVKEFSIRKVLGASWQNIAHLVNKEYFWVLGIGFGLGAPLSIWLMSMVVEHVFAVAKPFSIVPIAICLLVMTVTIGLTVYSQIRKVLVVNPASTLRKD